MQMSQSPPQSPWCPGGFPQKETKTPEQGEPSTKKSSVQDCLLLAVFLKQGTLSTLVGGHIPLSTQVPASETQPSHRPPLGPSHLPLKTKQPSLCYIGPESKHIHYWLPLRNKCFSVALAPFPQKRTHAERASGGLLLAEIPQLHRSAQLQLPSRPHLLPRFSSPVHRDSIRQTG